jgi:excisionase family DNA binding protein
VEQEFFSPEEIGKIFNISTYTIREWARKGRIKHVKVGRLMKIKREWVRDYFGEHTQQ